MSSSAPPSDTRPVLGIALRLVLDRKSVWVGITPPTPAEGEQGVDHALHILTRLYEGYLKTYGSRMDVGEAMGYLLARVPDQTQVEFYAQQERRGGSVVTLPEVVSVVRFQQAPAEQAPAERVVRGMAIRAFRQAGGDPVWFGTAYPKGSNPGTCITALFMRARTAVPELIPTGLKFFLLSAEPTEALLYAIEAANLVHPDVLDSMDETDVNQAWGPSVEGVH